MNLKSELELLVEIRNRMFGQQLAIEIDIVYFGRIVLRPFNNQEELTNYEQMLEKSKVQLQTTIECLDIIHNRITDLQVKKKKAN